MMKFLFLLFIPFYCFSQTSSDENKYAGYHFAAGFAIGAPVGLIHKDPKVALISSTVTAAGVGFLKEIHDTSHGKMFSITDFLSTAAGGFVSGVIIYKVKRKIIKNRLKKNEKKFVF